VLCLLLGSTTPIPADKLATLYSSKDVYQQKYAAAIDTDTNAGFLVPEDRDAILKDADPSRIPG
jgi:hypothetical protein